MTPDRDPPPYSLDALLPAEIAQKAETVGVTKARMDIVSLMTLSVLAGAFIALGAMFATTVLAGADGVLPFGVSRLLAGIVFSLGLVLVVLGGAELFTGNNLMVMAWAAGKLPLRAMLRAWLIVYVGNFIGAAATALLVFLSGQYAGGGGAVTAVVLQIALGKVTTPIEQAFFLGILCNVLVCLAVWLTLGARTTTDKVIAIVFPVSAFVAAGFEHSVANMYFVPLGLFVKAFAPAALWAQLGSSAADYAALTWPVFFLSLVPVTIGNIIGGGVMVGGVYWFVYLRPRSEA
ncbi:MAG: formate/nitrite transporter family protein [Pseudolabrys sp.]|nr:formate/nitrite transporter family protein [Pseudolabrys sp.]MDP2295958.1 formate/nitrite transporter family protein [Pseudolabrys sp.]